MKRNTHQWLTLLLTLVIALGALFGGKTAIFAQASGETETVTAFVLKKDTQPHFPLYRGSVAFRLLSGLAQSVKTAKKGRVEQAFRGGTASTAKKEKPTPLPRELCLGGETFGVRLLAEGVLVVSVNEQEEVHPAYDAGIRAADRIIAMNDQPIKKIDDVGKILDECGGNVIKVTCIREGKTHNFQLTPHYEAENGKYKAGIWIRDSVSGIGTLTYYHPKTGEFGGLGHGICDLDTGTLVPIKGGTVLDVSVTEIVKGEAGKPGELRGFLKHHKKGALIKNHECGVFGVLSPLPENGQTVPVATRAEVTEGKAFLRCALDGATPCDYEIKISDVHPDAKSSKCFAVTVTDPTLLAKTGGIIQGMSGSPIIQNGKLVGAVTHVLVGDPTRGYGIFIENMLDHM